MLCALTVRRLKPGSLDEFASGFVPPEDEVPAGWLRFDLIRDTADPDRIVTFGFFDGSLEDLERSQRQAGYNERRAAIEHLVEAVEVNGVFEVVKELVPPQRAAAMADG